MKKVFILMAFLLPMFVFSACSSDDDNIVRWNPYEQQFLGTWKAEVSDLNTSLDVNTSFQVTFSSDRTGMSYYISNGVKHVVERFTWRADASKLYVTVENQEQSGPYAFSDGKMNIDGIVYKKV